jgi:Bacterial Ig domain
MRFSAIFLLFSLCTVLACKKTETPAAPSVSIVSPAADDNFANDLVIKINGEAADADGLHTLSIKITDDKTKAVLFTQSPNVLNSKKYAFNTSWTAKVTDWVDATVTVTAANHGGVETVKTVKIKIWL